MHDGRECLLWKPDVQLQAIVKQQEPGRHITGIATLQTGIILAGHYCFTQFRYYLDILSI